MGSALPKMTSPLFEEPKHGAILMMPQNPEKLIIEIIDVLDEIPEQIEILQLCREQLLVDSPGQLIRLDVLLEWVVAALEDIHDRATVPAQNARTLLLSNKPVDRPSKVR